MMTMLAVRCCVSRDPKRRYLDVVKEDKQQAGVKEDERLTQVYGESAMATTDGKTGRRIYFHHIFSITPA